MNYSIYDSCQEKLDFINSFCTKIGIKYEFDIVYKKIWGVYEYALTQKLYDECVVFSCRDIYGFDNMLHAFCQALRICAFSCLD